jgi:hypothetical protein
MSYPAITTGALFTALLISDLIRRRKEDLGKHALLGLISVLIMLVLSQKGADFVAWGLLILPMFILALSFIIVFLRKTPETPVTPSVAAHPITTTATTGATVGLPASTQAAAACGAPPPPAPECPSTGATTPVATTESTPAPAPTNTHADIGLSPSVKC